MSDPDREWEMMFGTVKDQIWQHGDNPVFQKLTAHCKELREALKAYAGWMKEPIDNPMNSVSRQKRAIGFGTVNEGKLANEVLSKRPGDYPR